MKMLLREPQTASLRICYLPQMLPDELLYSWLGRLVAVNALGHPREYLKRLFGTKDVVPCVDLPTQLESLYMRLGIYSPCDSPDQLMEIGTIYPYHRAFLTQELDNAVRQIMLHNGGKGLKILMGRVANRFGASPPLRYCMSCIKEDTKHFGTPYWRRSHQLPGVKCCTKHQIDLIVHVSPSTTTDKQRIILPPFSPHTDPEQVVSSAQQLRFASLSKSLLDAGLPVLEPVQRRNAYFDAITALGFGSKRNHIDYDALALSVRNHYEDFHGFTHQERLLSSPAHPLSWLRTLIDRPSRSSHPVCHLLLIGYLFGTIDGFKEAIQAKQSEVRYPNAKAIVEVATPAENTDAQHAPLLHDVSLSCRQVAQALKLSVTTIVSRRRTLGIAIAERRKYLDQSILKAISKDLASGLTPSSIAVRHKVSLSTVYRMRAQFPALVQAHIDHENEQELHKRRKQWQRVVYKHRNAGITAARAASPATYAWLYRHDRTWLQETRVKQRSTKINTPRVDWNARDRELCQRLQQRVATLKRKSDRPRISKTLMSRDLGDAMIRANLDRLPMLQAKLDKLSESPFLFQLFRIDRAIDKLVKQDLPIQLWRIQRAAGIRHWTEALRRHADSKAAKATNRFLVS